MYEPLGEKQSRVIPLRWQGTEEMESAEASAILFGNEI